jgi:hypothetical protein
MDERRKGREPAGNGKGRSGAVLLAALAAMAIAAAAVPASAASAASADPGRNRDCAGQAGCTDAPGDATDAGVFLPALIVDLFPNPPAGTDGNGPAPGQGGDGPGNVSPGGSGASNPPPPGAAPAPAISAPVAPTQALAGDFVPDEVLASVDGGPAAVQEIASAFGLQVRSQRFSTLLGTTLARYGIPDGRPVGVVLAALAGDGRVLRRGANHVYTLQQAASVANYAFGRIALDPGSASGADVRIAVIDTGVDAGHPALKGVIAKEFDAMPDVAVSGRDHGTSVDGLIAGMPPFEGIAPGARIYHARAFEDGRSTIAVILDALDWAAEQDVRIVNMSFVGPKNELMRVACANARARGMVLVAAAGNNGPRAPFGYPAAFPGVIAVTATDAEDGLMQQANRGPYVYLAAPGVDMIAPIAGGSDLVTGTSFAAAIASGAIANLLHANPGLSADQVEKVLALTATDLGPAGRDEDFGYGLLNTKAAFAAK